MVAVMNRLNRHLLLSDRNRKLNSATNRPWLRPHAYRRELMDSDTLVLDQQTLNDLNIFTSTSADKSIFEFCNLHSQIENKKPLVVVPSSFNSVTEEELLAKGVSIVIYANHLLRSAYPSMVNTAKSILSNHRSLECDDTLMPIKDILELIPGTK